MTNEVILKSVGVSMTSLQLAVALRIIMRDSLGQSLFDDGVFKNFRKFQPITNSRPTRCQN